MVFSERILFLYYLLSWSGYLKEAKMIKTTMNIITMGINVIRAGILILR